MDNEKATSKLADIVRTGDADTKAERVAEGNLWEAERHARDGNLAGAGFHLEEAYRALGAEPPAATADDWAREKHPIQVEADRRCQEELEPGLGMTDEEWQRELRDLTQRAWDEGRKDLANILNITSASILEGLTRELRRKVDEYARGRLSAIWQEWTEAGTSDTLPGTSDN